MWHYVAQIKVTLYFLTKPYWQKTGNMNFTPILKFQLTLVSGVMSMLTSIWDISLVHHDAPLIWLSPTNTKNKKHATHGDDSGHEDKDGILSTTANFSELKVVRVCSSKYQNDHKWTWTPHPRSVFPNNCNHFHLHLCSDKSHQNIPWSPLHSSVFWKYCQILTSI